ncbi:peroxisomal acyl-coenzyme A oxidase 3-like [Homalodisca vitripennis]|uniref:peroxisomal acyl-coenzyme A oxidase 3-like n=1 Tax=Homalodisca vitripennis TaxID=197043 RepID=UPI001EEC72C8|nr:peroxisomal acyl-coenzyme A oxidase 3-like [Homalodisca vitripennis]
MSPAPGVSMMEESAATVNVSLLDKFRKEASFDWEKMRLNIEDPELLAVKCRVWRMLEQNQLFERRPAMLSDDEKRLTAKQLIELHHSGVFDNIHTQCYKKRTRYIMTVNEATNMYSPSLSVKHALGVTLFANAILSLGTDRHKKFFNDVWEGKILSCLALTELAHGSDTKRLRTTANYDSATQEFIIHTPDYQAAKYWVGNLGKQCTHAMVFAQLWAGNTCHGLHAFIVPVRDPTTLLPYPGLTIGDIGEKAGLHGIDNGFIIFNMYRIPRENLLNRIGDVTPDGEYETSFTDPQRILGAALENLSAGRVAIMQESSNSLACAVTIAVRYAAQRTQFCDLSGQEQPLLSYQLHQWRLFKHLAAAYVLKVFVRDFCNQYLDCVVLSHSGSEDMKMLSNMVSGVHAIVCCSKPLLTWAARDAIQEAREACGGNGYLKAAALGDLRNNHDPTVTYEGDNNVLLQQTTNWLLRQAQQLNGDSEQLYFPLSCVHYLTSTSLNNAHYYGRPVRSHNCSC